MSLTFRNINVVDIVFDDSSFIKNGIIHLDKMSIKTLIEKDPRVDTIDVDIVHPGESVRIVPVKDVIQPIVKDNGLAFPGIDCDAFEAGEGISYKLNGCSVVTTGPIVGFQEGIIDMSGPAAKYNIFSGLINVVLSIKKKTEITSHEHEDLIRRSGLKLAQYIGKLAIEYDVYTEEIIEWLPLSKKYHENEDLPKVLYVCQCMSQGLLHDTYFYGRDSKLITPTILSPLEILDGALISGNCVSPGSKTTTYHHQNNAVIIDCLKRHGKEINFLGVILNPLMTTLAEKKRNVVLVGKLAKMLNPDGVVISQEGFGNPTTDLMLVCKKLENNNIKTVIITNEDAGLDGLSESLPDGVSEANAIITTGNSNATILLPSMEKTIGFLPDIDRVTGGSAGCVKENGEIVFEIHGIIGSHNLQGNTYLSAITV